MNTKSTQLTGPIFLFFCLFEQICLLLNSHIGMTKINRKMLLFDIFLKFFYTEHVIIEIDRSSSVFIEIKLISFNLLNFFNQKLSKTILSDTLF